MSPVFIKTHISLPVLMSCCLSNEWDAYGDGSSCLLTSGDAQWPPHRGLRPGRLVTTANQHSGARAHRWRALTRTPPPRVCRAAAAGSPFYQALAPAAPGEAEDAAVPRRRCRQRENRRVAGESLVLSYICFKIHRYAFFFFFCFCPSWKINYPWRSYERHMLMSRQQFRKAKWGRLKTFKLTKKLLPASITTAGASKFKGIGPRCDEQLWLRPLCVPLIPP